MREGGGAERSGWEEIERDRWETANMTKAYLAMFNPPGIFDWSRVKHDHHHRASTQSAIYCVFCILRNGPASHRGGKGFIGLNCVLQNQIVRTTD